MRRLPISEVRSALLRCIVEKNSIQQLFDRVHNIISLPMICFDPSFSLIAYSFKRPFYYPHWEWMAEKGSASQENILEYGYLSNQEEMVRSHGPLLFDSGTTYGFAQYCGAIMNDNQLMAYCGIIAEDAERNDVREVTDMLIKAISVIMRRDIQNDAEFRSILLDDALTKQQAEQLSTFCPGSYLFVSGTCRAYQKSTLQFVRSNLIWKGFRMISCLYGDEILYILAGSQNSEQEREAFLNTLRGYAYDHGILFGLSDIFTDPSEVPVHRQQSVLAVSMTAASGQFTPISLFNDHYSDYICQCALEYYDTENCMFPAIKALSDEDKRRGTKNLQTLQAWFDSGMNNARAASVLGVHQATMINRLKHIAAATGLEPSEYFDSLRLEMSMYNSLKTQALHTGKR